MAETTTGAPAPDVTEASRLAVENAARSATASAAEIASICAEAGAPSSMIASLIREGATAEQARARINDAKEIRAHVDLARAQCPAIDANAADAFIASGSSIETVKAKLLDTILAKQSPEILTAHQSEAVESPENEAAKQAAAIVASYRGLTSSNKKAH